MNNITEEIVNIEEKSKRSLNSDITGLKPSAFTIKNDLEQDSEYNNFK